MKTSPALPSASLLGDDDFGKELVNWLFPAYVTLIVLSVFLFRAHGSMAQGNEMQFNRAVLTAVNTATLTGFQQSVGPDFFKGAAPFTVLLLTVAGSLFSLIVGGLAVRRILRLRFTDGQIIVAAGICQGLALLIGTVGGCGTSSTFIGALSQGAGAFANSGMMLGRPFTANAWQTHAIVLPVIILGGLGITVLMELFDLCVHNIPLSRHAHTVIIWTFGLYLAGVIGFTFLQWIDAPSSASSSGGWMPAPLSNARWLQIFASSAVTSINTRTAGIAFEPIFKYPRAMLWAMIPFMAIGASSGSTGGGLKPTTIHAIFTGARKTLRGQSPGRTFAIALSWLGIYLGVALLGLLMLIITEPQMAADQILFLTISALSNVGLSHDVLSVTAKSSYVLSALMLAGRMMPLLILWWMADTTSDAELAVG